MYVFIDLHLTVDFVSINYWFDLSIDFTFMYLFIDYQLNHVFSY
jgi:hypothetical protein